MNKKTGLNLTFEDFYWDFTEQFTTSFDWHKDVNLLSHAGLIIKELALKYNIYLSTARNSAGYDVINYILKRHRIADSFKGYHFVYSFNNEYEFLKKPKAEFISSFGGKASYFIDDSIEEVEKIKNIIPSLLFDQSGNKTISGAWTVRTWFDIAYLLL